MKQVWQWFTYDIHHQSGIDLKSCVKKPEDEEFNDWLAVHVVDFFNRTQILYGTVSEVCTDESCPLMTGTPKYEYLWADGDKFKVILNYSTVSGPPFHRRFFERFPGSFYFLGLNSCSSAQNCFKGIPHLPTTIILPNLRCHSNTAWTTDFSGFRNGWQVESGLRRQESTTWVNDSGFVKDWS